EVSWLNKQPRVTRVALDYPALQRTGRAIGLALRIGPFSGPFQADDERIRGLAELARSLVAEAETNRLQIAELQLDFDCAESKLDGYRLWVEAIRQRVAPVPVTITALPAWLKRPAFQRLVAAADGYVLQVHSLARPRSAEAPFTLCDPEAARRAVERAARLGRPFRVALPTYGYDVAFDSSGRFLGLSAEGPGKDWPAGTQRREIRTDPKAMAELVADWKDDRPQALAGVIWYRLPVADDTLNWRWPTLGAVMEGQVPRSDVRTETRQTQPGLVEIDLINAGRADGVVPGCVALHWRDARLVAADGLQGFDLAESGPDAAHFTSRTGNTRLEAGQRRTIGWVRMNQKTEVQVQLNSEDHDGNTKR
ncbi:MAG: DUF3142 domain-containing protein, partial [Phycisphaerales bacterium]|nr:DUF3142 domain-containing protein [Phycisphaerales bacterium]